MLLHFLTLSTRIYGQPLFRVRVVLNIMLFFLDHFSNFVCDYPLHKKSDLYDNFVAFRDYVASGQVRVLHVPSRFQYADIFTKGLLAALFMDFRSSLNVRRPPAPTAGEY